MPQYITLDEIKDGMILSEPVTNKFGNVLIAEDATLKVSHKGLLKTWNINTICIKSDGNEDDNDFLNPEQIAKARERLSTRMFWKPRNDIEKDLYNLGLLSTAMINNNIK